MRGKKKQWKGFDGKGFIESEALTGEEGIKTGFISSGRGSW